MPTDAASWRVRVLAALSLSKRVRVRSASLGLVVTRIYVRGLRRKNLEFFNREQDRSITEV